MLPIVRAGWTRPSRSYFRSVCGCMPSIRAAVEMKIRSSAIGGVRGVFQPSPLDMDQVWALIRAVSMFGSTLDGLREGPVAAFGRR